MLHIPELGFMFKCTYIHILVSVGCLPTLFCVCIYKSKGMEDVVQRYAVIVITSFFNFSDAVISLNIILDLRFVCEQKQKWKQKIYLVY